MQSLLKLHSPGLIVSEIFGPTFQGEGASLGTPCYFLRLGICNLACVWCDTKYTWDWKIYDPKKELHRMSPYEILERLSLLRTKNGHVSTLVVSGGEPMLQQVKLAAVLELVRRWGWRVEMETAGTLPPTVLTTSLVDQFNVSPKLGNSGNSKKKRLVPEALRDFDSTRKSKFKFVAQGLKDLTEVEAIVRSVPITKSPIYIMPEGVTKEEILWHTKVLAEAVINYGWNLTTRLHILTFGNRRGR